MSPAIEPIAAKDIFYSYSHKDEELRDELERHLSILKRSGVIRSWHDRKIDAGAEWAGQIHDNLNRANVILLLISADFLASDYCYDLEMKRALERHAAGEAIVIPIILRPVDWGSAPFARIQCLPTDARPVTSWTNRDEAFRNVAEGIRHAILKSARPPATEVQERALDAAIPSSVPVGKSCELLTLIRTAGSRGLKAILRVEEWHDATGEDVQSKPFRMEFPRNSKGGSDPQVINVKVESNDFEVVEPSKQIRVPPDGDSETCLFLLTPRRAGQLALIVEVLYEGITVASRLLRTNGDEGPQFAGSGTYRLASLPLTVYAHRAGLPGGFTRIVPPAPTPRSSEPGESTRSFEGRSGQPSWLPPQSKEAWPPPTVSDEEERAQGGWSPRAPAHAPSPAPVPTGGDDWLAREPSGKKTPVAPPPASPSRPSRAGIWVAMAVMLALAGSLILYLAIGR
jgi:TIR domain-containing protein